MTWYLVKLRDNFPCPATRFEVFTAVKIHVEFYWVVTPFSAVVVLKVSYHVILRRHNPDDKDLDNIPQYIKVKGKMEAGRSSATFVS
jgi:hypothetical protein